MDPKLLAMLAQIEAGLTAITKTVNSLATRVETVVLQTTETAKAVEKNITDLEEFAERFDEIVTQLEAERRLDFYAE